MTTRRRVATFSFSSDASNTTDGLHAGKTDLERKLELLEARFTLPLAANVGGGASSNNSSPATLDPENSSPASVPSTINNNNNSHQSFGFGTPSLHSHPETKRISASPAAPKNNTNGWQDIATAHIAKVMVMAQDQQSQDHTLLTSHVKRSASETSHPATILDAVVCVQESPPFLSPPIATETAVRT